MNVPEHHETASNRNPPPSAHFLPHVLYTGDSHHPPPPSLNLYQYLPHVLCTLLRPSHLHPPPPFPPNSPVSNLEFEESEDDYEEDQFEIDLDNMSYEEILELGERIGNVSIGLSEESIPKSLRTSLFTPHPTSSQSDQSDSEICTICQMEFEEDETMATLDCGHRYHEDCIKKWLQVKNECAICKRPALETVDEREG